ncbi:MAG: hypothetical protein IKI78_05955 [Clostridia bacterium]|nr:hypothetical protein [Clostridia bacterium]
MEKSLEELAAEYTAAAGIVAERIAERRKKLKLLLPASRRAAVLKSELRMLYRERSDALEIARKLSNYYS